MTTIDEAQAEQLWADLRDSLINAERKIIEIIEARAWEPLGYKTFSEAWEARMTGFRLSSDVLKSRVLYALYDEGHSTTEALRSLGRGSGVGPDAAEALYVSHDRGIPANIASTTVRRHTRSLPTGHRVVRVDVGPSRLEAYAAIAEQRGSTVSAEADRALRAWFEC